MNLAYSSSRIASNRLTREQVEDLYRTNKLRVAFESTKVDDIIEIMNHFIGGKNVKKVLIASDFKRDNEKSENSFLNRAKEMGITFIANATEMTPTKWKNVFKNMV